MDFLIVEDEKHNANRLQKIVEQLSTDYRVIDILDTKEATIAWLNDNTHPDIILMDIRLADGISLDIFDQVTINSVVIFTTAYDEYAVQAFKVNGVDYLLKPIEKEELAAAIEKARRLTPKASDNPYLSELISFMNQKESKYRIRFLFPYKDGYKTIRVSDIDMIFSEAKSTHLVLHDGALQLTGQTLEELEQQLNPADFFRANRQYIVNINSLESIHNHFNGKLKVVVRNNSQHEILISKEKAPVFKQWLDQ